MRHSIFEDFDIVFGQVINEGAFRIAGRKGDINQSNVDPNRFLPHAVYGIEANQRGKEENARRRPGPEW